MRAYEDGGPAGPMARRVGFDPLSLRLHTGGELPPRRGWVDPYPTGHLFYAPVDRQTREARVESIDRFERSYEAVLRL